ncbi:uncharacterized protein PRCAT00003151001 [Priceomyces carsonii]|uniref:uncharacterized protein n=1 Tax=Priceomyces carsonii TaxID=28549 RepID=UPI002ED89631|nr:unnamed protein product [Priceomyces carsonii]
MARTRKASGRKAEDIIPRTEDIKESSTPNADNIRQLPHEVIHITEQDILASNNSKDLMNFINTLTNTSQDEIFKKFKQTTSLQLKQDSQLIKQLQNELHEKQMHVDSLTKEIATLKSQSGVSPESLNTFESPIRGKNTKSNLINENQLSKELENIGITLDMLELLTGLRIMNYQEDESRFFFDVKQNSTNDSQVFIEYRLIISKNFGASAEINYIPTFLEIEETDYYGDDYEEKNDNCKILRKVLPDYLCDNLSFPYNTLSQFYTKINRALNKTK